MPSPSFFRIVLFLLIIISAWGCKEFLRYKEQVTWTKEKALVVSESGSPQLTELDAANLKVALDRSIEYFEKSSADGVTFGKDTVSRERLVSSYRAFSAFLSQNPSITSVNQYLIDHFKIYRSGASSVLFTGYYVPLLFGSYKESSRFRFPLYKTPPDLVSIELSKEIKANLSPHVPVINRGRVSNHTVAIPYYSRKEIEGERKLKGKGLELLWVDNEVDLFFLHIQGSGIVELDDGRKITVGYADKNGQPYRAIGKTLLEKGLLKKGEINLFTIKNLLQSRSEIVQEVLETNPSYCFFKVLETTPVGALNFPVTGVQSIATDLALFPKGALALIQTEEDTYSPRGQKSGVKPMTKLMLNQDTGGAIRGADRVDIFYGEGNEAENRAGRMQSKGMLYFLAPR